MKTFNIDVNSTRAVIESESVKTLDFKVSTFNWALGETLLIDLGEVMTAGQKISIAIEYETNPSGNAFSWLSAFQTAGKALPYMYTQCEDINCRTVAPMQDTPANRVTYSAQVIALNAFTPKMSANETGKASNNSTTTVTSFANDIPIPSYLLAIAIGDLEYRSLGERVGVITEPSQMNATVAELEDMSSFLDKLEAYMGPYIWGNYTILILPPSFPLGGMENPLLTFASPTVIVGDKSQVDVVIHEMAHSWTGN